ncbi:Uncharacterised protein [uncultured archaeon]|nr:Uncharacterised protein [uncultured archaeon]
MFDEASQAAWACKDTMTMMTIKDFNINAPSRRCDICNVEHSEKTASCRECNNIIEKHKNKCTTSEVRNALKRAYSRTENGIRLFKCEYTRIESHFNITNKSIDPIDDALILTFDHKNPIFKSNRGEVVVCLFIINQIKGKIPFGCFKNIITVLAEYFNNKNQENSDKIRETLINIKNFYNEEKLKS